MAHAPHLLTGSRFIRRRSSASGWWLGVLVAGAANLLIVWVLARISHNEHPPEIPQLATRSLHQEEPPPPPPPPPPETRPEEPPPVAQLALPALDLAPATVDSSFTLPPMPVEDLVTLPLTIPPIRIEGPVEHGPTTVAGDGLDALPDEPARVSPGVEAILERFYPRQARNRGVTGESVVRLAISASGSVTAVDVISSTPPGVFDQAVVRAAMALTFSPAKRAGKPFATLQTLTIQWILRK